MSAAASVTQKNRLVQRSEPRIPEPAQLYSLVVLTFVLHRSLTIGDLCEQCGLPWPCPQVCLAFRLREGF